MRRASFLVFVLTLAVHSIAAEPMMIEPAAAPIQIDGSLTDAGWQQATKYETWYETNPGDNIEPKVKTVGYITYDSRFLYIGVESEDPRPNAISSPYADHDQISGNTDDYVGIIVDTRNDGKTAYLFLITARGVQYDAVTDDAGAGEDSSPDFFWDSAATIHERGWTAEARIPFSSLRYESANPDQWALVLYRNYPRDRRYQMFTSKLPRDSNCFVCNFGKVGGLRNLPTGDHIVVAPYVTTNQLGEARDPLGGTRSDYVNHQVGADGGLDLKWNPTADMAVDATINPDFSQVESDVAVIETNERFAIFIPEKRPFFLEGVELFSTPIQAVYTRTITAPRWGARTTGKTGDYAYTMLVTQDRGGGSVILPSSTGSDFADQDFSSIAAIGRIRRDFGRSFVSFLGTTREAEGGAYNRVFGPDFQWRRGDKLTLTGQFLYSSTQNPDRPDIHSAWNGEKFSGHAAYLWGSWSDAKKDFFLNYSNYGEDFRADNGFVPQVGWRGSYGEAGYTLRPKGFFSRFRMFGFGEYQQDQEGELLYRTASAGFGADGKFRSFTRIRLASESVANRGEIFDRNRVYYTIQFAVNRVLTYVSIDGWTGDEVDFVHNRLGKGSNVGVNLQMRAGNHLQLSFTNSLRWLNVEGDRLFTSQVERLRATYTFNPRMFVRAIVQNTRTHRDLALYGEPEDGDRYRGNVAAQMLFAYKLNWQTVFYVGLGDLQGVTPQEGDLEPANRQYFAKVSYAFQR